MRKTAFAALLLVVTAACSTNPATGKREFNIVSEGQEVELGRQTHPEIVQQFGIYDEKPELNRLVNEVGQRIAAQSDRPNLPWTFTLLDSPMVNAMALPGGYIYITRGMMERINSEDELAGVLGHEIAHVTARHSAQQMSRAQLAQLGMVLGSVVAGPEATQAYGQLAELGLNLLFQRYSRAQETQADLIGTEYMAESRYNPVGAERMLMVLQRLDDGRSSGLDRYFMSHPDPAKRVRDVRSKIAELRTDQAMISSAGLDRDDYLRRLDGVITGNSTEKIVIKGNTVYDRAHGLVLTAPNGWEPTTAPGVLFAMAPRGDTQGQQAQLVVQEVPIATLRGQGSNAQEAVRSRLQQMGLAYAGSRQASVNSGQRFPIDVWTGQTQSGQVAVETTQFEHGDHVAVFMFISPNVTRSNSPLGAVLQNATIDLARARSVSPPRLRIGTVRQGETWRDLARRATGNVNDAKTIAHINGFELDQPPQAGMTVKLPEEVDV